LTPEKIITIPSTAQNTPSDKKMPQHLAGLSAAVGPTIN